MYEPLPTPRSCSPEGLQQHPLWEFVLNRQWAQPSVSSTIEGSTYSARVPSCEGEGLSTPVEGGASFGVSSGMVCGSVAMVLARAASPAAECLFVGIQTAQVGTESGRCGPGCRTCHAAVPLTGPLQEQVEREWPTVSRNNRLTS